MAYRLRMDESVEAGVRRIAISQLNLALEDLDPGRPDRDAGVHRARRRVKRVRALIRLIRPGLGEQFASEDSRLRDAARLLAGSRDATVAVETYDAILERFRAEADRRALGPIRRELTLRHRERAARPDASHAHEMFRRELAMARNGVRRWSLASSGFGAVAGGLRATYRRGRRLMGAAYRRPTDDRFHAWRQQVRYHELHCALLRAVWKPVLRTRRGEAERLAEMLGAEHDLAVLSTMLRAVPAAFGGGLAVDTFLRFVERRRGELRAQARPLGRRLFAERPAAFEDRLARYWKSRRSEGTGTLLMAAPLGHPGGAAVLRVPNILPAHTSAPRRHVQGTPGAEPSAN